MDTAGRLQIDKGMMDELKGVKKVLNPTQVLLVVDCRTGQEAADTLLIYYTLVKKIRNILKIKKSVTVSIVHHFPQIYYKVALMRIGRRGRSSFNTIIKKSAVLEEAPTTEVGFSHLPTQRRKNFHSLSPTHRRSYASLNSSSAFILSLEFMLQRNFISICD